MSPFEEIIRGHVLLHITEVLGKKMLVFEDIRVDEIAPSDLANCPRGSTVKVFRDNVEIDIGHAWECDSRSSKFCLSGFTRTAPDSVRPEINTHPFPEIVGNLCASWFLSGDLLKVDIDHSLLRTRILMRAGLEEGDEVPEVIYWTETAPNARE